MSDTWHYQLMKHTEDDGIVWYGIHENFPKIGYTHNAVTIMGEDKGDIIWQLKAILNDIEKYEVKDYEQNVADLG